MNPIAQRLSEASLLMENTPHPEIAEAFRIGANEIERLQHERNVYEAALRQRQRCYDEVKAERDRLRESLETIASEINSEKGNLHGTVLQSIARRALAPT